MSVERFDSKTSAETVELLQTLANTGESLAPGVAGSWGRRLPADEALIKNAKQQQQGLVEITRNLRTTIEVLNSALETSP